MARKKSEEVEVSLDELSTRVHNEVSRDYGEGVMVDGASLVSRPPARISLSPALDLITSGGIEEGSWVGVTGLPKTGKTSLCLSLAASCQKAEHGSRPIYYLMAEGRLSTSHLQGVAGLDLSPGRFTIIRSREGRILVAQDFLRIASTIIRTVPGAVLIIDSASALCDENEMNSDIAEQAYASGHKLFSKFIRTNAQVVPVNRTIVMVITHLLANIGKPGSSERVARATQYQYDYMLRTLYKKPMMAQERQVGLEIRWSCGTSKLGPPGMEISSYLRFGVGIDRLFESMLLGIECGLIRKSGTWYYLDFLCQDGQVSVDGNEPPKAQGEQKLYQKLLDNPAWNQLLAGRLASMAAPLLSQSCE